MNKGGRPLHPYWKEGNFTRLQDKSDPKKFLAVCDFCGFTLANAAVDRLKVHRTSTCKITSSNLHNSETSENKSPNTQVTVDTGDVRNREKSLSVSSFEEIEDIQPMKEMIKRDSCQSVQETISLPDSVDEQHSAMIDTAIGNFFIANNIPFNVLNSKYFKDLLCLMRPAYSPPSVDQLKTLFLK